MITVVIDIDDEDYKRIQDIPDVFNSLTSRTYLAIRNGTPLPKGHGRLIDADEFIKEVENLPKEPNGYSKVYDEARIIMMIEATQTIIEADKTESNGIIISRNLCDSCINNGCIFQSGIVRNHCDFYKAESGEV